MLRLLIVVGLFILSFANVDSTIAGAAPDPPSKPTGPTSAPRLSDRASLDCTKVGSTVAKILCGSREGAMADWDLNSTLWAIAGATTEAQQKTFDQDQDRWRGWLSNKCALPTPPVCDISQEQQRCSIIEFHSRAAKLRSKLTGNALTESKLSPEQHAQIQELLIALGLLQPSADGEFGSSTRRAMRTFQGLIGAQQTGFLSNEQVSQLRTAKASSSQSPLPASAAMPSFDCSKATYADEYAICSNPELSQLDNISKAGYEYIRGALGHQYANSTTLPLLRAWRACADNLACIKERQLATIQVFRALGAPIIQISAATPPAPANILPNAPPLESCTAASARSVGIAYFNRRPDSFLSLSTRHPEVTCTARPTSWANRCGCNVRTA
jgi:uncharacterized protein